MEVKHPRRILAVGAPGAPVLDVVKGAQPSRWATHPQTDI